MPFEFEYCLYDHHFGLKANRLSMRTGQRYVSDSDALVCGNARILPELHPGFAVRRQSRTKTTAASLVCEECEIEL